MEKLKLEIKQWEYSFKKENGRAPSKDDIKQNSAIAEKYRDYRLLKKGSGHPETPSKRKSHVLNTPQKTSPPSTEDIEDTPILVRELGPTPQLNGRVLSIFDVITSPSTTPIKQIKTVTTTFSTPSKKLDFSSAMDDEHKESAESNTTDSFKTPQKTNSTPFLETPQYFKSGPCSQIITASPSPLASQRIRKGLSAIINELHDIQDDLKYGDYDEEELIPPEELNGIDDNVNESSDTKYGETVAPVYKKRLTQKRTTRRVKMKSRPTIEQDDLADKDLKLEIKKLETVKEIEEIEDGSEEWSEEEDGTYVRERLDPNQKTKVPMRKNFKRLKINKRKGGFFGKRSKW